MRAQFFFPFPKASHRFLQHLLLLKQVLFILLGAKQQRQVLQKHRGWLDAMIRSVMKHSYRECKSLGNRQMGAQLINALLILLRDGLAYLYLIQQLLAGQLSLGDFVLIFAAINGFASWISLILENGSLLLRSSWSLSKVRAFLDLPSRRYSTGVRPSLSQCSPPRATKGRSLKAS